MTKNPLRRWSEEGATRGELDFLRAARAEEPSTLARRRTLVALGLGTAGLLAAPVSGAAHAISKVAMVAVAKWTAIGAVCGVVVATTANTLLPPAVDSSAPTAAAAHGRQASGGHSAKSGARTAQTRAPDFESLPAWELPPVDQSPVSPEPSTATGPFASPDSPAAIPSPVPLPDHGENRDREQGASTRHAEHAPAHGLSLSSAGGATRGASEPAAAGELARDTQSDRPPWNNAHPLALPADIAPWTSPEAPSGPKAASLDLGRELLQLDRVRRALAEGNPKAALSMLEGYEAQMGHGSLSTEALVLRVQALWMAGDKQRARALVERFSAANPDSPYRGRLRRLVQAPP